MRVSQAAKKIGCSPQQLRHLIRNGKIEVERIQSNDNQFGFIYDISETEVERVRHLRKTGRGREHSGM